METPAGSPTDGELFDAWQAGERAAGQALIERHYDPVLRFFKSKAGSHADDLVQRTFLRCTEARERFRKASSFRTFVFGIARNVLFEHIRRATKHRARTPDFSVQTLRDLSPGISTAADARAQHRLLVDGLQHLPVEMQMAIELHYWEGLSVAEVAEIIEVPPGTVKSRLHRGRTLLREIMASLPAGAQERASVRDLLTDWAQGVRGHVADK